LPNPTYPRPSPSTHFTLDTLHSNTYTIIYLLAHQDAFIAYNAYVEHVVPTKQFATFDFFDEKFNGDHSASNKEFAELLHSAFGI
jgi:hypothetical protein